MSNKVYGFAVVDGPVIQTLSVHETVGGAFAAAQPYFNWRIQEFKDRSARANDDGIRDIMRGQIDNHTSDAAAATYASNWHGMDNIYGQKVWRFQGSYTNVELLVTEYALKT